MILKLNQLLCLLGILLLLTVSNRPVQSLEYNEPMRYNYYNFSEKLLRDSENKEIKELTFSENWNKINFTLYDELLCYQDTFYGRFFSLIDSVKLRLGNDIKSNERLAYMILMLTAGDFWNIVGGADESSAAESGGLDRLELYWLSFYACLSHYTPPWSSIGFCYLSLVGYKNDRFQYAFVWPRLAIGTDECSHSIYLPLFLLAICHNYGHNYPFLCPNLCLGRLEKEDRRAEAGDPCELIEHAVPKTCTMTRKWDAYLTQFFKDLLFKIMEYSHFAEIRDLITEDGYTCDCNSSYEWNVVKMKCVKVVPQCHSAGTENITAGRCFCKDNFMGDDCSLPVDPCLSKMNELIDSEGIKKQVTGVYMCNVNMSGMNVANTTTSGQHNQCWPQLGTSKYRCQCQHPYGPDSNISLPNCWRRQSPCDRMLCVHGRCVATSEGNTRDATCVCNLGFDGRFCQYEVWMTVNFLV